MLLAQRIFAVGGCLIFGAGSTVISKFLYEQEATGLPSYTNPRHFDKPWFQTWCMFVAMFLSLLVYLGEVLYKKHKGGDEEPEEKEVYDVNDKSIPLAKRRPWVIYFYIAAPAACDCAATTIMNIGLLYIHASVWQMLRGAMILFSSIFSAFILKRPTYLYMWMSVVLIIIALVIVGVSAVLSTGVSDSTVTQGQVILAIFLVIIAQVIQAGQIVIEEFILKDNDMPPTFVVGIEGMWGTIYTSFIFLPIMQHLPGKEGIGLHEDTLDTFAMIGDNPTILGFIIFKIIDILLYNITAMMTTKVTSAVVRTIMDALRTLVTWVVMLIVYYSMDGQMGESWTQFSWIQLVGFVILIFGTFTYNATLKLPCIFKYPEAVNPEEVSDDNPLDNEMKEIPGDDPIPTD